MCLLKYAKIVARDMWMKIQLNDFFRWQRRQHSQAYKLIYSNI
jgi:hypothetical protein